jgi:LysM repeat protein
MSKETRIGLLVGLLFIIMFGLVLADMLNNPNTTPGNSSPGSVAMVTNTAASGGEGDREYGYIPTTPAMDSERHPTPAAAPVPTRPASGGAATADTPAPAGGGSVMVSVAPPDALPVAGDVTGTRAPGSGTTRPAGGDRVAAVTGGDVHTEAIGDLPPMVHTADEARGAHSEHGSDVAMGEEARSTDASSGTSLYEVKQGDSLYKIAAQIWGAKNACKNSLILAANKDKIKNASNLKVGMKLVIPPLPGSAAAAPLATPTPTTGPSTPTPRSRHDRSPSEVAGGTPGEGTLPPLIADGIAPTDAHAAAGKTYTIKSGDTILRLAKTYRTSVDKILELNKGVNPIKLKIGQKLTIPS